MLAELGPMWAQSRDPQEAQVLLVQMELQAQQVKPEPLVLTLLFRVLQAQPDLTVLQVLRAQTALQVLRVPQAQMEPPEAQDPMEPLVPQVQPDLTEQLEQLDLTAQLD